jgi:hypothetical protein
MSKTFSEEIDKKAMSGFPRFSFVLSRFRVLLGDGSSKTLQKTFWAVQKVMSYHVKIFYKETDKKAKPIFGYFLDLFDRIFWGVSR